MSQLGLAEEWLQATATSAAAPAVRFSSFFPFVGDTLLVVPPRSLWPPPGIHQDSLQGRALRSAFGDRIAAIARKRSTKTAGPWMARASAWCLPNQGRGPFRVALRSSAGVDRLQNAAVEVHSTACLEFRARAASGPSFSLPMKLPRRNGRRRFRARCCCWPIPAWAASGRAAGAARKRPSGSRGRRRKLPLEQPTIARTGCCRSTRQPKTTQWIGSAATTPPCRGSGRIESSARWGEPKQPTTMIAEGSVLLASNELRGAASNVAPEGFPHPVYRAGFAVTVPIPWRVAA